MVKGRRSTEAVMGKTTLLMEARDGTGSGKSLFERGVRAFLGRDLLVIVEVIIDALIDEYGKHEHEGHEDDLLQYQSTEVYIEGKKKEAARASFA